MERELTQIYRKSVVPGHYFQISIIDHGIGMSSEQKSHLFEPFFTTKEKGTGLGLAISYSIISNHKGYILLESELGKGTKFDIFIPIVDISESSEAKHKKDHVLYNGTVLIIEDNTDVQNALSKMLQKIGFSVKQAFNGNEAIQIIDEMQNKDIECVFLIIDLILPGEIGGQAILKKIHEKNPKIKAIVSSGYSKGNIIENYEEFGFSAVLNKPYSMDQLIETIKKVLSLYI